MGGEESIERARTAYERAVYGGDVSGLAAAERDLEAVEAGVALARGRLRHARFLHDRSQHNRSPQGEFQHEAATEDPAELPLFERALTLCRAAGDRRGEGEALFWIGCLHQVIRRDDATAVPLLEQSERLAAEAGDRATRAEALRHLGIAAHAARRLDEARVRLEESSRLRREIGALPGVASNMIGLAYLATAQGRPDDALDILDEADAIARAHGAGAILGHIDEARAQIRPGVSAPD
jgi:tetratricopeptide (TPR) repeat protein